MEQENAADTLRQYFELVLAAEGLAPSDWGYACSVYEVAQRVLSRSYFSGPSPSAAEETAILAALKALAECPLKPVGQPGTWWLVQARLRQAVPLAIQLLSKQDAG